MGCGRPTIALPGMSAHIRTSSMLGLRLSTMARSVPPPCGPKRTPAFSSTVLRKADGLARVPSGLRSATSPTMLILANASLITFSSIVGAASALGGLNAPELVPSEVPPPRDGSITVLCHRNMIAELDTPVGPL